MNIYPPLGARKARLICALPNPFKKVRLFLFSTCFLVAFAAHGQTTPSDPQEQPASQPQVATPAEPQNTTESAAQTAANGVEEALAQQGMSAELWLQRLAHATSTINFEISYVVTTTGREITPYLWRHAVMPDGTSMEQLNVQNGPGQELIRVGNIVSVFEPDSAPFSIHGDAIDGPIPSELLYHPERLHRSYHFLKLGRARVSGRTAQLIRIVSKDDSRYSYQIWLDEETGLLLKYNMVDMKGALMEQIQVTAMNLLTDAPAYFSRINQAMLPKVTVLTHQEHQHSWEVEYLPAGMKEVKREVRRLPITGQMVEYKLFSDGMVDVSVYVQSASNALGENLAARRELNTFLTLTDGQVQVTVVGEIPLETAQVIANSLRIVENNRD